jgi:uncharacterized damage-inducible protein DinB
MNIATYARAMAAYNQWMNEKIYSCAAELSDEERKRDMGAFFGSIHRTLNHIYVGDEAWLQRFEGQPVTMKSPADQPFEDFEALRNARRVLDEKITHWAERVSDELADGVFQIWSVTYQRRIDLPGWAAVVQIFNHQTHHRGQVTTLLKQLGKDPGPTDLPVMPGIAK